MKHVEGVLSSKLKLAYFTPLYDWCRMCGCSKLSNHPIFGGSYNLSIFGVMRGFWTIPTANMTYIRSQNHTIMVVGEHGGHTFKVAVVVLLFLLLSFDVFVLTSAQALLFLDKWFVQIYLYVSHVHLEFGMLDGNPQVSMNTLNIDMLDSLTSWSLMIFKKFSSSI